MKQQTVTKAFKQGFVQTIKQRDYFNPFSAVSKIEKHQEFERGRKQAIEEMKITVEEPLDISSTGHIPPTKSEQ